MNPEADLTRWHSVLSPMPSVSKNINIQEPLLSDSVNSLASFSENFDGSLSNSETRSPSRHSLIPSDINPNGGLLISPPLPPREILDKSLPFSPAKTVPAKAVDDRLISTPVNAPRDNSSSLIAHKTAKENSPSLSSPIFKYNNHRLEPSSSTMSSPYSRGSHSGELRPSISWQEAKYLVGAGLANLGNTCFINSIMQCLTHTTLLVQGLRSTNHMQICQCRDDNFCLLCAVHDHIELSLHFSGGIVFPYKLANNINYISADFQIFYQEDAHEFLQCLLDKLGEDCSSLMENNGIFAPESVNLVKRIFGGRLTSKICCCNCGNLSNTYEPLMDLSLEIENVDSLLGALESFTRVEKMDDPEMTYTCEKCKKEVSIEKQLMIDKVPSVAVFHLKRFKIGGNFVEKIEKHVKFPLKLDLKPYTSSAKDADDEVKYELYGVIEHIGNTSDSGHYISFIRPSRDAWYIFNDAKVTMVPANYVLSCDAYILFYARQGTPWLSTLMETRNQRFYYNPSLPLPVYKLNRAKLIHGACQSETIIDNTHTTDESTEFGYLVPSQIPSDHLLTQHSENAEEEPRNHSRDDEEEDDGNMDFSIILTPPESPEPNTTVFESREKEVNSETPLKKEEEDSEKREALRYVKRRVPSSRRMKLITAMLDEAAPSTRKTKKRPRTAPCKKTNSPIAPSSSKLATQDSVPRFVAAGN